VDQKKMILFADDDPLTQEMVKQVLESAGYAVLLAESGMEAVQIVQQEPVNLVLLDIMMPVMDGYETCQAIQEISSVPIIFLTALIDEEEIVNCFTMGAYDCITKPFRARELVARIKAVLQRAPGAPNPCGRILTCKDLVLDQKSRRVRKNGSLLNLSPTSYQLLGYFMLHPGQLVTKGDLLHNVWSSQHPVGGDNMVEAAIKRLRKELGDDPRNQYYIKTIWGQGYRFCVKNE
jgi:DNA-binding response OmpR family regulator